MNSAPDEFTDDELNALLDEVEKDFDTSQGESSTLKIVDTHQKPVEQRHDPVTSDSDSTNQAVVDSHIANQERWTPLQIIGATTFLLLIGFALWFILGETGRWIVIFMCLFFGIPAMALSRNTFLKVIGITLLVIFALAAWIA